MVEMSAMHAYCRKDKSVQEEETQWQMIRVSEGRTQPMEQKMISKISTKKKLGKKQFWRQKELTVREEILSQAAKLKDIFNEWLYFKSKSGIPLVNRGLKYFLFLSNVSYKSNTHTQNPLQLFLCQN